MAVGSTDGMFSFKCFEFMFFFFFKQKTAYEIKECDWSSDVCSSDLWPLLYLLFYGQILKIVISY